MTLPQLRLIDRQVFSEFWSASENLLNLTPKSIERVLRQHSLNPELVRHLLSTEAMKELVLNDHVLRPLAFRHLRDPALAEEFLRVRHPGTLPIVFFVQVSPSQAKCLQDEAMKQAGLIYPPFRSSQTSSRPFILMRSWPPRILLGSLPLLHEIIGWEWRFIVLSRRATSLPPWLFLLPAVLS